MNLFCLKIELVVDRIKQDRPGKRILVVMPTGYLRKIIPNSVNKRRNRTNKMWKVTDDDIVRYFPSLVTFNIQLNYNLAYKTANS